MQLNSHLLHSYVLKSTVLSSVQDCTAPSIKRNCCTAPSIQRNYCTAPSITAQHQAYNELLHSRM